MKASYALLKNNQAYFANAKDKRLLSENDYLFPTNELSSPATVQAAASPAASYIIGSTKNKITNCFHLLDTTGKDEWLRAQLNAIKNELFLDEEGTTKCCVENCTHKKKNGEPCVRMCALHLGIENETRFYMLAIGCSIVNTNGSDTITIKENSPVAFRLYHPKNVKVPYLLKTNVTLREKITLLEEQLQNLLL